MSEDDSGRSQADPVNLRARAESLASVQAKIIAELNASIDATKRLIQRINEDSIDDCN